MRSISTESFRSMFDKNYIKIFAVGILVLIVGIILAMARGLYLTFADPTTPSQYERYIETINTLTTLSGFLIQLGMLFFALSTFMGGVIDESLSPEVRRGLVFASSIAIIALALIIIFQGIFIV